MRFGKDNEILCNLFASLECTDIEKKNPAESVIALEDCSKVAEPDKTFLTFGILTAYQSDFLCVLMLGNYFQYVLDDAEAKKEDCIYTFNRKIR